MAWQLLLVPLVPALVFGLLALSAWVEQRTLSPQAMILRAVRTNGSPEIAEHLVTVETARLLAANPFVVEEPPA
jgi:hypothetical protein